MTIVKKISRGVLTLLFTIVMIIACMVIMKNVVYAANSVEMYTNGESGITTNEYEYSETPSFYVSFECDIASDDWPWIGIYKGSKNVDSTFAGSMVYAYLDATAKHGSHRGQVFNLIGDGQYYGYNSSDWSPGEYTLALFAKDDESSCIAVKNFTITGESPEPTTVVTTDKASYEIGEAINVKCVTQDTTGGWIGVYKTDTTVSPSSHGTPAYIWYYPEKDGVESTQNILAVSNENYGNEYSGPSLPPGDYKAVYLDSDYNVLSQADFAVTGTIASSLVANKRRYKAGEDIMVTASSTQMNIGAWVGLYDIEDPADLLGGYYYYYFVRDHSNETVNIFNQEDGKNTKQLTTKGYRVILFKDNGVDVDKIYTFTIEHYYSDPTWTWNDDHTQATATFNCVDDSSEAAKTITVSGDDITYAKTEDATCTEAETGKYTATISSVDFLTESDKTSFSNTVDGTKGEPLGHNYGGATYEWSDDYSVCTGTAVCQNDSEHVLKEEAMGSMVSMKPASCSEEGSKNYEANFSDSIFEKQTNTEILPKLEHELDYENGTITKAPTADEDGEWELTCKVCKDTVKKPLDKITYASILIDKLPKAEDLKLEDENAVKEARAAYDMLTEEQKAEFKETLEAAEAKIAELKKAAEEAAKDAAKEAATPVLDEAKAIKNEDGKYTEDSYKALTDAVAALESELAKEDATAESINSAAQVVKDAVSGLKEAEQKPDEGGDEQKPDEGGDIPGASEEAQKQEAISEARSALNSANAIKAEDYTADSYNAFKEAKEALEKAVEDATSAKEIKDALNKFNEAKDSLVRQSPDTKPADGDVPSDGSQGGDSVTPSDTAYAVGAEVTSGGHKYVVTGATTVALKKAKNAKKVTVPASVKLSDGKTYKVTQVNAKAFTGKKIKTVTIGKNVKKLAKNAFKSSKATKMIVKTKFLKKASVKGSLKESKIKTVQVKVGSKKVNKKFVKKYKKIFTKKIAGKKVKVK